jgi:hypothetical protein
MKSARALLLIFGLAVCVVLIMTTVAAQQKPPVNSSARIEKHGDWDTINLNQFYLGNCIWGKGAITDYNQIIWAQLDTSSLPVGWTWRWPALDPGQVKAYPDISFGKNPWNKKSTSAWLPLRMDKIDELTVAYDIAHRENGKYNLSFDIWVTKTPDVTDPPEANINREIMIWQDAQGEGLILDDRVSRRVVIDGENYRFCFAKNLAMPMQSQRNYARDYLSFHRESPEYSGETRIHLFLKYLLDNKYIAPGDYLRNVDLGNEVYFGSGETILNRYSITVRTGGKTGVTALSPAQAPAVSPLTLRAKNARLNTTARLAIETTAEGGNVGWWTSVADEIIWQLSVPKDGVYAVSVRIACDKRFPGSKIGVTVGGRTLFFTVPDTGEWSNYRDLAIGNIVLKAGSYPVKVKAVNIVGDFVCNLRSLTFSWQIPPASNK